MFPIVASYAQDCLAPDSRNIVVAEALRVLEPHAEEFDAIAFQGMSGAVIAPILACFMEKYLIFVRKGDSYGECGVGESCHSSNKVEGPCGPVRFLIVDDFIAGGNTMKRIYKQVRKYNPLAVCVGIYLWTPGVKRTIFDVSNTKDPVYVPVYFPTAVNILMNQPGRYRGWWPDETCDVLKTQDDWISG